MKRNLLLLICFGLFGASCASSAQIKKTPAPQFVGALENLLKKQILLTNAAEFTGGRTLEGGSAFLLRYNNRIFAVTAKHLLGEAGGVEPEVNTVALDKNLLRWRMSPRVVADSAKETVAVNAKNLDFSGSLNDILLLNSASNTFDLAILEPNFALPVAGETLYLIGCPYSETACKQNVYKLRFAEYDKAEALLFCEMSDNVNLAGFSGAPVVNQNGEAVGVLISSIEANGKVYAAATHIKEIEKIEIVAGKAK